IFATAPSAQAKDLNGRFGMGIEQSIGGVSGLTFRYWPTESLGVMATVGADIVTQTNFKFLNTTVVASTGFVYNFAESLHANFGAGLRFALGFQTDSATSADNIQFDIEVPLTAEFFLSDNFSVSVAAGLLIAVVPGAGPVLEDGHSDKYPEGVDTVRFGIGAITGNVGVVYYF
ncbi:MAG: hypothetical protein QF464_22395, partial [Myxococcota bacterium]|nr:hypothetical protein [Myxococcota bacterium]